MNDFNRKVEDASARVGQTIGEAAERAQAGDRPVAPHHRVRVAAGGDLKFLHRVLWLGHLPAACPGATGPAAVRVPAMATRMCSPLSAAVAGVAILLLVDRNLLGAQAAAGLLNVKAGELLAEIDTPEVDAQLNESRASIIVSQ